MAQLNQNSHVLIFLSIFMSFWFASGQETQPGPTNSVRNSQTHNSSNRYPLVTWQFEHVQYPFVVGIWLLSACYMKVIFNIWPKLSHVFPDSSLLIVTGLLFGGLFRLIGDNIDKAVYNLTPDLFFQFLLPPIVFEAAYFMPKRVFFDNIGVILIFSVFGTLWNTFAIGGSLYGLGVLFPNLYSFDTDFMHIMLFSSLIAAVDPVAVLAVFDEMGVNEVLHITVFGESLLNDAVTVVLYNIFSAFVEMGSANIQPIDYVTGVGSFFVVSSGGVLIGLIFAILTAISTKYTDHHVKVVAPVMVLIIPYLAYYSAGAVSFSEILAICTCGLVMHDYVKENISFKSKVSITKLTQMLASSSETILFFFLGLSAVNNVHTLNFDPWFIVFTCVFCIVYRAIAILNRYRAVKFTLYEQIIMVYGGLRGAVAYGLAMSMPNTHGLQKDTYLATTIVVILFTVFIQGITIKPLVKFLKIQLKETDRKTINQMVNERLFDHTLAGLEEICAFRGQHSYRMKFEHVNNKYIKPLLTKKSRFSPDMRIVRAAESFVTQEAIVSAQRRLTRKLTTVENNRPDGLSPSMTFTEIRKVNAPMTNLNVPNVIITTPNNENENADYMGAAGVSNPAYVHPQVNLTMSPQRSDLGHSRSGSIQTRSSLTVSEDDVKHWLNDTDAIRSMKPRHSVVHVGL